MGDVIPLLALAANLISWVFYSKYQFIERDTRTLEANRKWHFWGAVNRASVLAILWSHTGFVVATICGLLYFVLFDALINLWALKRPISYIGKTARMDIIAGKIFQSGWWYLVFKLALIAVFAILFI
jgi:hypothetical protein